MFNGLAAGNIGDELMLLGFWNSCQPSADSSIEVWSGDSPALNGMPNKYRYLPWTDNQACETAALAAQAILIVGTTLVSEYLGVEWPLEALSQRLLFCHAHHLPVHALGVGIDVLSNPAALKIFGAAFLPIQSWTVRSHRSREALVALGVPSDRVVVGADWAWLYQPIQDKQNWAAKQWQSLGVDLDRPLVAVNVVNEIWGGVTPAKQVIATALDQIAQMMGAQIAFLCHETREEEFADIFAARTVMSLMRQPAVLVPNHYYHPDEVIGLLSHADVTLSQRYHFTVASILAETVPVSFARGQKMVELLEDLQMKPVGTMEEVELEVLIAAILDNLHRRVYWLNHLAQRRRRLAAKATNNSYFIKTLLV